MYKFEFYVPEKNADTVKEAVFSAGAGKIGRYDCCCWQCAGTGQFRPLQGSSPSTGSQGNVEKVAELKIEMVCDDELIGDLVSALEKAHPYETPAYQYWKVQD